MILEEMNYSNFYKFDQRNKKDRFLIIQVVGEHDPFGTQKSRRAIAL